MSQVTANGGFFLTNLFSFMNPTPLALQTPPELQAYGWTTVDLWCAPLITGLYALLTHAQPFWAETHAVISGMLGQAEIAEGKIAVEALDPDTARAVCAIILAGLFATRTVKNFGFASQELKVEAAKKIRGTCCLFISLPVAHVLCRREGEDLVIIRLDLMTFAMVVLNGEIKLTWNQSLIRYVLFFRAMETFYRAGIYGIAVPS